MWNWLAVIFFGGLTWICWTFFGQEQHRTTGIWILYIYFIGCGIGMNVWQAKEFANELTTAQRLNAEWVAHGGQIVEKFQAIVEKFQAIEAQQDRLWKRLSELGSQLDDQTQLISDLSPDERVATAHLRQAVRSLEKQLSHLTHPSP